MRRFHHAVIRRIDYKITFYQPSSNLSHHDEFRYEFNQGNFSFSESRRILLLTGRNRAGTD